MSGNVASPDPAGHPRTRGRISGGQIIADLLLTVGTLLALFVIYETFWTNLASGRLQNDATAQLDDRWSDSPVATDDPATPPVPALGQAFSRVHLPALGQDAVYTVVEGTRDEDLRTGPGHYVGTQMPGEPGNFALAGHRNGSGAVFQHLDRLNSCDAVVVETQSQWLIYRLVPMETDGPNRQAAAQQCLTPQQTERVTLGDYSHVQGRHITTPEVIEVIAPLPGVPEIAEPGTTSESVPGLERMLTLTTCHPQFSNAERLIIHAILAETTSKSDGALPAALSER